MVCLLLQGRKCFLAKDGNPSLTESLNGKGDVFFIHLQSLSFHIHVSILENPKSRDPTKYRNDNG